MLSGWMEILAVIGITLGIGVFIGAALGYRDGYKDGHYAAVEESETPKVTYHCCMHCVDPTTGKYTPNHFDSRNKLVQNNHELPCTETACFAGNLVNDVNGRS